MQANTQTNVVKSMYLVQTKVIPLSIIPFQDAGYFTEEYIRITKPSFLFDNSNCIKHCKNRPYGKVPFIPFLGRLIINTRQFYYYKPSYIHDDSKREEFLTYAIESRADHYFSITGFNNSLVEQRLGTVYYELEKPIFIKAIIDKISVTGKVFLHLYPSGHLIIHIAFSCSPINSDDQCKDIIEQTKPWGVNTTVLWSCPNQKVTGSLSQVLQKIYERIAGFVYNSDYRQFFFDSESRQKWFLTNNMMIQDVLSSKVNRILEDNRIIRKNHDLFDTNHGFSRFGDYRFDDYYDCFSITDNECFYLTNPDRNRQKRLKAFWKIMHLIEVAHYCKTNLNQYNMFFEQDSISIKTRLYQRKYAWIPRSMFESTHYDNKILAHIFQLRFFYNDLSPFYQKIWYLLTKEFKIDKIQEEVDSKSQKWIDEVDKLSDKPSIVKVLFSFLTQIGIMPSGKE